MAVAKKRVAAETMETIETIETGVSPFMNNLTFRILFS
jgi:hypothetical protein